jgi:hypothetical protein
LPKNGETTLSSKQIKQDNTRTNSVKIDDATTQDNDRKSASFLSQRQQGKYHHP